MFDATLFLYSFAYFFMWYYEIDIFEVIFGIKVVKFSIPEDSEDHWSFVLLWGVTSPIIEIENFLLRHWFTHFLALAFTFCFIDPLVVIQFLMWARATFLPFFQACFTFSLWIFRFCKAVFKKIKKKVLVTDKHLDTDAFHATIGTLAIQKKLKVSRLTTHLAYCLCCIGISDDMILHGGLKTRP